MVVWSNNSIKENSEVEIARADFFEARTALGLEPLARDGHLSR